jgi:hypothetical protein
VTVTADLMVTAPVVPAVFGSSSAPVRRSLVDILEDTVRAHPGAAAIDNGADPLSYRELAERVDAVRAMRGWTGRRCPRCRADTSDGSVAVRQMHDLGSFAMRGTAPLLARVLKADGDSYETGLNDVRTYGLKRPAEAADVPIANGARSRDDGGGGGRVHLHRDDAAEPLAVQRVQGLIPQAAGPV